jgi:hypothetical protein
MDDIISQRLVVSNLKHPPGGGVDQVAVAFQCHSMLVRVKTVYIYASPDC